MIFLPHYMWAENNKVILISYSDSYSTYSSLGIEAQRRALTRSAAAFEDGRHKGRRTHSMEEVRVIQPTVFAVS